MKISLVLILLLSLPTWANPEQWTQDFLESWEKRTTSMKDSLPALEQDLHPQLYKELRQALNKPRKGVFFDFDPFFSTQGGVSSYDSKTVRVKGNRAQVLVTVTYQGARGSSKSSPKYFLEKSGSGNWQVSDIVYPTIQDRPNNLRGLIRYISEWHS